jgi:glycosyltransferase involved in cell wall biosynthesis
MLQSDWRTHLKASVVITTKNRKEDLGRTLRSCLAQTAGPEVIVIDDGSEDGSEEMVRREFPAVRVFRDEVCRGLIVQRNRGAQIASGDVIFSIDDDAEFSSPEIVAQTLADFDDPCIGAIAIPLINVRDGNAVLQRAPDPNGTFVTSSFIGTAHALRRDIFLAVGGYRGFLVQQGEEEDLCIRMMDIGRFVRLGHADPIYHYESPARDFRRWRIYAARNRLLFSWYNVPMPHLLWHFPAVAVNQAVFGTRKGQPLWTMRGLVKGVADCVNQRAERRAVRPETYRLFRRLRHQAMLLEAIVDRYGFHSPAVGACVPGFGGHPD